MSICPFRCRRCDGAARAEACHFCPVTLFPVTISHDPTEKCSAYTDLRLLITPNTWKRGLMYPSLTPPVEKDPMSAALCSPLHVFVRRDK